MLSMDVGVGMPAGVDLQGLAAFGLEQGSLVYGVPVCQYQQLRLDIKALGAVKPRIMHIGPSLHSLR